MREKVVLYIGGFELPDKNAAAQRVIGIAKGLRTIGYKVVFLNCKKKCKERGTVKKEYYGFSCYESRRECELDYLIIGKTALSMIKKIKPEIIIAYNYPSVALNHIRKYCNKNGISCYADVTEWYQATSGTLMYRALKNIDTVFRMQYVHKKVDGAIVISRYLFNYYNKSVRTVLIPPTVDINDAKWSIEKEKNCHCVSFVYAGSPSMQKERIDFIVEAISQICEKYPVHLDVVGITEEDFRKMYSWGRKKAECITFWGRMEHVEALKIVNNADWSIILRENNKVVKAGFPTKLVESISCGTPVIANAFSNIDEYLDDENSIMISSIEELYPAIEKSIDKKVVVNVSVFDFHNYIHELKQLLGSVKN